MLWVYPNAQLHMNSDMKIYPYRDQLALTRQLRQDQENELNEALQCDNIEIHVSVSGCLNQIQNVKLTSINRNNVNDCELTQLPLPCS